MSISVNHISKSYKKVKALQDISFEVKSGELFGLIGPDGAGKTTLFRILTTLLFVNKGSATAAGFDVITDYKKNRNRVGCMTKKFSLYQDLTVKENLNFFATIFGTTFEENYNIIKNIYVQIEPFKDRRAGKLSGKMKQKLALCCALIHKPKILFLDESTTRSDPVSRRKIWDMLKRLQQKGITILVSTPYMDEAGLCYRIALIKDGKILKIDTPNAIVKHFTKQIFNVRSNKMYQLINSLNAYKHNHSVCPFGEFVYYTVSKTNFNQNALKTYLESENLLDITISKTEPTIEDTFMELAK